MSASGADPPPLDPAYIVGPLLVSNSLSWALWGVLSAQLAFFISDVPRRRKNDTSGRGAAAVSHVGTGTRRRFRFGRRNVNGNKSPDEDVNPWRKTFVPPPNGPSVNAYPSYQHARQRSSKSVPSSFDPNSPTAGHPSPVDTDAQSILLPSSTSAGSLSVYLTLMLCALYVLVCVRTVLITTQFWRVSITGWGFIRPDPSHRWMGMVLADLVGPIIFIITLAYFIYSLYFSPSSFVKTRTSGLTLRPMSLKPKANVLPEPYSFPFPQSPHSPTSSPQSFRQRFMQPNHAEPALLGIAALFVSICGLVDCAKSFKGRPPGEPVYLDAVTLIWFAGMLAIDILLCVLLCRSLWSELLRGSWMARIGRIMGEAGGTQLLVAFVSLVLIVSWRHGKPPSTLTFVAPSVLPVLYANTVFLHVLSSLRRPSEFRTPSRIPSKAVASKFEDIEMGVRESQSVASRPTHVDLAGAAAAGADSAYSTTADSGDGGAMMRDQAMAYGREREAAASRMHIERDTFGGSSTSHLAVPTANTDGGGNASASGAEMAKVKALSVRSGVSEALSLELPTFRRGKAHSGYWSAYPGAWEIEESGSEGGSDWDEELDLDSEEDGGGTWDYGFAKEEREKERAAAATMLASGSNIPGVGPNEGGTRAGLQSAGTGRRWQPFSLSQGKRSSYPALGPSSREKDTEEDENADTVSMLSGTSRRSRARHSYYHPGQPHPYPHYPHPQKQHPQGPRNKTFNRLLPRTPGALSPLGRESRRNSLPPSAGASTDSVFLAGPGSPAGSVLVIGRGAVREPSIAEQSVNRAASVAATRASTGSMWSTFSYTYPRPVHLPDLDLDLVGGGSGMGGGGTVGDGGGGGAGDGKARGKEGERESEEQDLGTLAFGGLTGESVGMGKDGSTPHPYSAAAGAGAAVSSVGEGPGGDESARRRWNVHPLKRIAEMGRMRF